MDNRRIQGPDQSTNYYMYAKSDKLKNFVSNQREDCRKSEELRKICTKYFFYISFIKLCY